MSRTKTDKVGAALIARLCDAQQPLGWTPPAAEVRQLQALVRRLESTTDYTNLLKEHGIRISMSRRGNPYDNARAESFMKTLKFEEDYLYEYEDLF